MNREAEERLASPSHVEPPEMEMTDVSGAQPQHHKAGSGPNWHQLKRKVHAINALHHIREDAQMIGSIHPVQWRDDTQDTKRDPHMVVGEPRCCLLNPDHNVAAYWDAVVVALLIYTVIFLPWRLAFLEKNYDALDVVVDSLFMLDLIITFFRAYEDDEGRLVVDHKLIAIHYLKGWFLLDLIAAFPFYFFFDSSASRATTLVRIPRLLKLFRLLRLLKLFRANALADTVGHVKDSSNFHPGLFRLLKLLCWVLVTVHVCGCIFIFLPQVPWLDENDGWLVYFDLTNMDDWDQYTISIYFVCASLTSTGYGDYRPTNNTERIYSCIVMLGGVAMLAYSTATLTSVFRSYDLESTQYRIHMEKLASFMKHVRLDHELQARMRKHFSFLYSKPPLSFDAQNILSNTPKELRSEVVRAVHKGLIQATPLLHTSDEDFVTECLINLQPVKLEKGDIVAKQGRPTNQWYILVSGAVEMVSSVTGTPLLSLRAGATLGEIGILMTGTWLCTITCSSHCKFMSLTKRQMLLLLDAFPSTRDKLFRLAQRRLERLASQLREQVLRQNSVKGITGRPRGLSTVAAIDNALAQAKASQTDTGHVVKVPRFAGAAVAANGVIPDRTKTLSKGIAPRPFQAQDSDSDAGDEKNQRDELMTDNLLPGTVMSAANEQIAAALLHTADSMATLSAHAASQQNLPGVMVHSMTQNAFDEAVPHAPAASAEHTHVSLCALQARVQGLEALLLATARHVGVPEEDISNTKLQELQALASAHQLADTGKVPHSPHDDVADAPDPQPQDDNSLFMAALIGQNDSVSVTQSGKQ